MTAGLFPEELAGPREGQDARRTVIRLRLLRAGEHPVTHNNLHADAAPVDDRNAPGLRCDTCAACETEEYHDRTYVKCRTAGRSRGPGTDTRRWYPACILYTPGQT